ncbi:MAG: DotU family type IV/VI secretion system protein [Thermoanaerobaculia bacterium]
MFVTEKFQQFHAELTRLQERLREGNMAFDSDAPADARGAGLSASAAWRRILNVLERQEQDAVRQGGDLGLELYKRAQYAMAALADEIFLHLDWSGRDAWRLNLVEAKLFGTHRAGEELFERIDELLRDRDNGHTEIARIYLSVLALGFQGKFRGRPDAEAEIEVIRRRLYRFIFGRDPRVVRGREAVAPQAYMGTIERPRVELPHLKPWIWAIVLVTLVWLTGQHLIWQHTMTQIQPLVDRILEPDMSAVPATTTTTGARP